MRRLTYAMAKSIALVSSKNSPKGSKGVWLVYKDAGGDYCVREINGGESICYTSIGCIVTNNRIIESREEVSRIIEGQHVSMIYAKFI